MLVHPVEMLHIDQIRLDPDNVYRHNDAEQQRLVAHQWKRFTTPLERRTDIDWAAIEQQPDAGLTLKQVAPQIKSARMRRLLADAKNPPRS